MLNEAPAQERAAAPHHHFFTGVGQLTSGAGRRHIAASFGGVALQLGLLASFGLVALVMILLAAGLKNRAAELATITQSAVTPCCPTPR